MERAAILRTASDPNPPRPPFDCHFPTAGRDGRWDSGLVKTRQSTVVVCLIVRCMGNGMVVHVESLTPRLFSARTLFVASGGMEKGFRVTRSGLYVPRQYYCIEQAVLLRYSHSTTSYNSSNQEAPKQRHGQASWAGR